MLLEYLAPVDNLRFELEDLLEKQTYSVLPLPFSGMDKSAAAVCEKFLNSACDKQNLCPYRHVSGDKSVVCKHWLRGLCKKGDECEFLHEYDMSKMPECFFYSKYKVCGNKECEFLHIDKELKIKDCPWYDRGFCRHGPNCKNRHQKKVLCQNYLFGFCPDGPECKFKHPKFDLPVGDANQPQKVKVIFVCEYCGEKGHKVTSCFKLNPENRIQYQLRKEGILLHGINTASTTSANASFSSTIGGELQPHDTESQDSEMNTSRTSESQSQDMKDNQAKPAQQPQQQQQQQPQQQQMRHHNYHQMRHHHHNHHHHHHHHHNHNQPHFHHQNQHSDRPHQQPVALADVTCFKCGEKGHYANRCNKTIISFLRGGQN